MKKTHSWKWQGRLTSAALGVTLAFGAGAAFAQVKIGVTLSATGPAASLGIPEKNTIALLPKEIGGKTVEYIVLDDGSDTSRAVQNTRKLIDEDHVDAIVGSTVTPSAALVSRPFHFSGLVFFIASSPDAMPSRTPCALLRVVMNLLSCGRGLTAAQSIFGHCLCLDSFSLNVSHQASAAEPV